MPAPTTGSCSFQNPASSTVAVPCNQIVASSTLITFESNYVFADTGALVLLVTGAVVAGVIALMGLGFGIRHVKRWITGRKF